MLQEASKLTFTKTPILTISVLPIKVNYTETEDVIYSTE